MVSLLKNVQFAMFGASAYRNFADLADNQEEQVDYRVVTGVRPDSDAAIIAPHGGKIEFRTSEIAAAIAGDELNLYVLEGIRRSRNFRFLHLTSERFDDPRCLEIIRRCSRVISIHGCAGNYPLVLLGGLDSDLISKIETALRRDQIPVRKAPASLGGRGTNNICNRGATGMGVQIEISRALRGTTLESALVNSLRGLRVNQPSE